MTNESIEARLVELESQLAQTQRTIEELNEEVVRQGQKLDRLMAQVEVLGHEILRETEGEAEPHIKHGG
jgi:uncharacterized coiled-coil protein SlyX